MRRASAPSAWRIAPALMANCAAQSGDQSGMVISRGGSALGRAGKVARSSLDLPGVAPDDLAYADHQQAHPVARPVRVVFHEALPHAAPGEVETLQRPDAAHEDEQKPEQAADDAHDDVERVSQNNHPPIFL